jgi:hypothetical protein
MMTSYSAIVWLAYIIIIRRSSSSRLSISAVVLYPISRISSGAESGSPARYDSRRTVLSDAVFIDSPGS